MMITLRKHIFPIIVIILMMISLSGCDKTAKSTNRAPVINSFTPSFSGASASPESVIKVTVNFTDPDIPGTPLVSEYTFSWTVRSIEPANVQFDEGNNFLIDDDQT
ncbi:MAG: hypothetical protein ABIG42_05340, partial [bacterium]